MGVYYQGVICAVWVEGCMQWGKAIILTPPLLEHGVSVHAGWRERGGGGGEFFFTTSFCARRS